MKSHATQIKLDDIDSLWQGLRDGDRKGLEGIYRHFAERLFKFGLSMVSDEDFVQDCIQEVFIDIWKYHKNLQKADNVKMYLFRSLSHKINRESKKEKKWKKEEIQENLESCLCEESKETDIICLQREDLLQKKLALALQELPVRQKEVIQYLFFESFSYEETAELMGINLRSVYTLAWKAVSNLKKAMLSVLLTLNFYHFLL